MLSVKVTPRAAEQIEAAVNWWRVNRPAASGALLEEFEAALKVISRQPRIGAKASNAKLSGVRRLYLARIRYVLYYQIRAKPQRVEVLALWHASRGRSPPL